MGGETEEGGGAERGGLARNERKPKSITGAQAKGMLRISELGGGRRRKHGRMEKAGMHAKTVVDELIPAKQGTRCSECASREGRRTVECRQ